MTRLISDLEQRLQTLAAAEREVRLLAGRPAPSVHFRRTGGWFVEEQFLIGLLRARLRRRPIAVPARLADLRFGRLLRALVQSQRVPAQSHAKVFLVKKHIRAFYLEPRRFSLKLATPAKSDAMRRDVEARPKACMLGAPAILSHSFDGPYPHYCEEWLSGIHPDPVLDAAEVIRFAIGDLWESYRSSGFEWRSCADSHDLEALIGIFDAMTDGITWPPHRPARETLRNGLLGLASQATALVPWCLGHGDLSIGNMIVADGRIRLIDWERTRRLPLLMELAKVLVAIPQSWEPISARMLDEFKDVPEPGMLAPDLQAALAALERLAELRIRFGAASPADLPASREASRFERRLAAEVDYLVSRIPI